MNTAVLEDNMAVCIKNLKVLFNLDKIVSDVHKDIKYLYNMEPVIVAKIELLDV